MFGTQPSADIGAFQEPFAMVQAEVLLLVPGADSVA